MLLIRRPPPRREPSPGGSWSFEHRVFECRIPAGFGERRRPDVGDRMARKVNPRTFGSLYGRLSPSVPSNVHVHSLKARPHYYLLYFLYH